MKFVKSFPVNALNIPSTPNVIVIPAKKLNIFLSFALRSETMTGTMMKVHGLKMLKSPSRYA